MMFEKHGFPLTESSRLCSKVGEAMLDIHWLPSTLGFCTKILALLNITDKMELISSNSFQN